MKFGQNAFAAGLLAMFVSLTAHSKTLTPLSRGYLGRWDVTLKDSTKTYPTWLEITQGDNQLKVRMVGRWGHARFLPKAELSDGGIGFTSPKEEEGGKDTDMVFEGKLSGEALVGTVSGPDGAKWTWTGKRAPSLERKTSPRWGKPITLFDGKDMSAWSSSNPAAATSWKIANGTLVSPGHGSNLLTKAKFDDFKLHIEFNCAPKSNSGVYLRGRYEVQIEDDPEPEGPTMRTGGVYGFLAPSSEAPRTPGVWQSYDITLVGRMVTVVLNGKTMIDSQEIPGITGEALDSQEGLPGPIDLQGSEDGQVSFRNIIVTPAIRVR
jgi:hypothetical protein